jgi:hypothetical protein
MGLFDFDLGDIFGGGGGDASAGDGTTVIPVGQDINAEGDANKFDWKKAYGFGTDRIGNADTTTEESRFEQMRRKQMGAGGT